MKIRGKEVNLKSPSNYTVKLGTVNNKEPKCIYFEIKGWITPLEDNELNYNEIIRRLTKRTKTKLTQLIDKNKFHDEVYILDLDLRDSGVEYGKRSYYNCEITLYQENEIRTLLELEEDITKMSNTIIDEVFEPFEYFDFYKSKK